MKGRTDEANKICCEFEASAEKVTGSKLGPVTQEEIQRRVDEGEVKELPWAFLFKKKMLARTLTAMLLCFTMNVLVYTIISWTPSILKANGFDVHLATTMTVVM